jgi:gas vesicle protein GvpA/GvpJ/GvpM family
MTASQIEPLSPGASQHYGSGRGRGEPANLGDILERVLDKGLVIAGDIRVNLLDIELLTIKLRLIIASLDTARQVGINWWENDPWLSSAASAKAADGSSDRELADENRRLRARIRALEASADDAEDDAEDDVEPRPDGDRDD